MQAAYDLSLLGGGAAANTKLLLQIALGIYGLCAAVAFWRLGWARHVLAAGLVVHLASLVWRGWLIGFFPLTNKMESFGAASLAITTVIWLAWRPSKVYVLSTLVVGIAALVTALSFPQDLVLPPPLMRTIWYPLHVPFSFFAYGVWVAAAGGAMAWWKTRDVVWLSRIDTLALIGFVLWTLSMICGGFWGVVAWGAYFMWDPKIIWSVLLWFFYATFIHVRLTPSLSGRLHLRPALAVVGLACVFVAYVGTSFFFGKSSHAFG